MVSIRALAWSATIHRYLLLFLLVGFNPRARMERDFDIWGYQGRYDVSIHALAWSATLYYG